MKKLGYLFLSSICILLLTHCTKDSDFATMTYKETKCADRWDSNENDSDEVRRTTIIDYLFNDLRIDVTTLTITFDEESVQECEACSCTTGRVITVEVEKNQVATLEVIGFKL